MCDLGALDSEEASGRVLHTWATHLGVNKRDHEC